MSTTKRIQGNQTLRMAVSLMLQMLVVSLFSVTSAVAQDGENQLKNIDVRALAGNKIELRLDLTGPAPEPLTFTIDEPARIGARCGRLNRKRRFRQVDNDAGGFGQHERARFNGRRNAEGEAGCVP